MQKPCRQIMQQHFAQLNMVFATDVINRARKCHCRVAHHHSYIRETVAVPACPRGTIRTLGAPHSNQQHHHLLCVVCDSEVVNIGQHLFSG